MFVVDLLHEFELGIWKGLFTHLVHILYAAATDGSLITELNWRYDQLIYQFSVVFHLSPQVSPNLNFRQRYYPAILQQCLGNETTGWS